MIDKKQFFNSLILGVLFVFTNTDCNAQYYKKSHQNFAILITNAISNNSNTQLYNTFEIGKEIKPVLLHSGIGIFNPLSEQNDGIRKPTLYYSTIGLDANIYRFCIMDLSKKSFCKILGGSIKIGIDIQKNINTELTKDYGYRAKILLDIFISKSGSAKKDIGLSRNIEFGYCFMNIKCQNNNNYAYHCLMLNLLLVKHKLIKFANW